MVEHKVKDASSTNVQIGIVKEYVLHMLLVQLSINLRPWTLYSKLSNIFLDVITRRTYPNSCTLSPIKYLKLDPG